MEFMQVLRRFFSIRGYPAVMRNDNRSQMVGAARELQKWSKVLTKISYASSVQKKALNGSSQPQQHPIRMDM